MIEFTETAVTDRFLPELPGVDATIGDLDSYIKATAKIPLLSLEEEQSLCIRFREEQDLAAAQTMVLSHLRLVVSTARGYLGFGLPHGDLIQEGNIGLMKAVKGFDARKGYRLVTYALPWIRAEIQNYCMSNHRISKIATTKPQRKLFFNLKRHRIDNKPLTQGQITALSAQLNVPQRDVREMEIRLFTGDIPLESQNDNDEHFSSPITYLETVETEPTFVMERQARDRMHSSGIESALTSLDERSRRIIESRWLQDDEASSKTLQELAIEFGVSSERIRQIETAAMKKMKTSLLSFN